MCMYESFKHRGKEYENDTYSVYHDNETTTPQSSDDIFIHHNDNYLSYYNLNPADYDAASMYKINSNDIDITKATTRMVSTTATLTCIDNYHVYHDNWGDHMHNMATMMTALQTIRNTSCGINFDGTTII